MAEKMAKGKRNQNEEGLGSDDEAPAAKQAKKEDSIDESVLMCELSSNRRVTVKNWNGKVFVDIRDFYTKDGKQLPGKKGISLTKDQWNIFRDRVEEIDRAVNESS